jgi:hypothetical protein
VRLADLYVPAGSRPTAWSELARPDGLCDVRATFFLRPAGANPMEGLRLRRIASTLRSAAQTGRVVHLWWHPHNFGRDAEASLAFLEHILRVFDECRDRHGMESLSMVEAAERALGESPRGAEGLG